MQRSTRALLAAALVFVPAILLLDGAALSRQLLLAAVTAFFLVVIARTARIETRQVLVAIVIATTGECILSIAWGLYSYRYAALLPLYVPVGHGIFYALAAATAKEAFPRRHSARIVTAVLTAGSLYAIGSLLFRGDAWGMIWWLAAAALIATSRNQLLVSVCCIYTVLLEWLGTALGNWRWAAEVPYVGLHSANPPSGVGILYIVLDLVTVAICARLDSWRGVSFSDDALTLD